MEREGLVENSAKMGAYFLRPAARARSATIPMSASVRGVGPDDGGRVRRRQEGASASSTRKAGPHRVVAKKALELGVLVRALPYIEVNSFSPPLCITKAEIDEAVERYGKALDAATPELKRLAG